MSITRFHLNSAGPLILSVNFRAGKKNGIYPFTGVVTQAGVLSTHPVGGTENIEGGPYRILITEETMKGKIDGLMGKNVFATDTFDTHDNGIRVGEFMNAWLQESADQEGAIDVCVSGEIMSKYNPDLVDKILQLARTGELGFSYDLKGISWEIKTVAGEKDSGTDAEQILELTDFTWRGATILKRDAAAYEETTLAAKKAVIVNSSRKESPFMDAKDQAELQTLFQTVVDTSLKPLQTELATIKAAQTKLEAAIKPAPNKALGETVSFATFGNILAEANKPLVDAVAALSAEVVKLGAAKPATPPEGNQRKTLSIEQLEVVAKYVPGTKEEEVTEETLEAAKAKIAGSNMSFEQKAAELGKIGAAIRQVRLAAQFSKKGGD